MKKKWTLIVSMIILLVLAGVGIIAYSKMYVPTVELRWLDADRQETLEKEDARIIWNIIRTEKRIYATPECIVDYSFVINGEVYQYSSSCGSVWASGQGWALDTRDDVKEQIDAVLQKYGASLMA